jgi:hypothetical protein
MRVRGCYTIQMQLRSNVRVKQELQLLPSHKHNHPRQHSRKMLQAPAH